MVKESQPELHEEFEKLSLEIVERGQLNELRVKYVLEEHIRKAQKECAEIKKLIESIGKGVALDYRIDDQGTVWLKDRICVPRDEEIRKTILTEAYQSRYSIHPGCTKMYHDLKSRFWWKKMKVDIVEFVARCDVCRRIKAKH
ncbi:unnamed protein product [Urochloa humidicola]